MWPYLFGSGWLWDTLLSAGILAGIIVACAVLLAPQDEPARPVDAVHDRLQTVWHAYEQGDLTEWEFARLITPRPAMQPRHWFPAAAMPAGDTAAHDAAAD